MVTADEQGVVILFSNDTMLCAKAKINKIRACDRKVCSTTVDNRCLVVGIYFYIFHFNAARIYYQS